jgi:hypothetical protein
VQNNPPAPTGIPLVDAIAAIADVYAAAAAAIPEKRNG